MPEARAKPPLSWILATEYPATNISGVGLYAFAGELQARLDGAEIEIVTDRPGLTSQTIVQLAADAHIAGGDVYASALSGIDPVFAIPALPFQTRSIEHAYALLNRCLPLYEAAFRRLGHTFLFATVWPATGLWSDRPIENIASLKALKIRTNDPNSAHVFRHIGVDASYMPFADAVALLKRGQLNAVLTSGDGGAGQKLWDYLGHFTPLNYAIPCSFAFVANWAMETLTPAQAAHVHAAAAGAQQMQAAGLKDRISANFDRMRQHGVTIARHAPADALAILRDAGSTLSAQWTQPLGAGVQAALAKSQIES